MASNFTQDDVNMLRRLFKQQMDIARLSGRNSEVTVSRATRIDELADRVEQELDQPTTKEP